MWAGGGGEYGDFQVAQGSGCNLSPGLPSGYVCIRLEGKPTAHSGYFYVLPQQAYWVTFWWNDSSSTVDGQPPGTQLMHVYTAEGTPIPCATTTGCTTLAANGVIAADTIPNQTAILTTSDYGGGLNHITFGNYENGGNTGTTTYFQNLMMNYTTGQFPLFWASGTTGTQPQPPTNIKATAQ